MYSSEECIFTTPPTSPYTSRHSLTSRSETIYESALDLMQLSSDLECNDLNDVKDTLEQNKFVIENEETQKVIEKPKREESSLVKPEIHEPNITKNNDYQLESLNVVDDYNEPFLNDDLPKQDNTTVSDIQERINQMCIAMSDYVPSAMAITINPCNMDRDVKPYEIMNWLQQKRGDITITDFLKINFDETYGQVNVFQQLQSRIFMLFIFILVDASNLISEVFITEDKYISKIIEANFKTWIEEIELIFKVLLNTSYININISEININALEQPVSVMMDLARDDSSKCVDFHKSLKEMKLLRKQMAGIPSKTEKVFICFSIIMFLIDMATDIMQTLTYHNEGNAMWPLIAVFVVVPSLVGSVVCFAYWRRDHPTTKKELRLKRLGVVMIPLQLGQVWQEVCRLFDKYLIMDSYNALSLLLMQMLEGLFEGGPQALIQTYVLFGHDIKTVSLQNILHVASPLMSSLSMAYAITNVDFGRLSMTVSFKTKISFVICRLGEVWARFIVYVAIFYSFRIYGLVLILIQVIMLMIPTFWLIRRDHKQRQGRDVNCVYLRCRHGGFYEVTPTRVFKSKLIRCFVWISIPFLYSLVPLQRFEIDFEYIGFSSQRPPFWKCNRRFVMFNLLYAMHHFFNIVGFGIWFVAGRITDEDFFIPMCVLFAGGTFISVVIRIQSWLGRTYNTSFQNNIPANRYQGNSMKAQESHI